MNATISLNTRGMVERSREMLRQFAVPGSAVASESTLPRDVVDTNIGSWTGAYRGATRDARTAIAGSSLVAVGGLLGATVAGACGAAFVASTLCGISAVGIIGIGKALWTAHTARRKAVDSASALSTQRQSESATDAKPTMPGQIGPLPRYAALQRAAQLVSRRDDFGSWIKREAVSSAVGLAVTGGLGALFGWSIASVVGLTVGQLALDATSRVLTVRADNRELRDLANDYNIAG